MACILGRKSSSRKKLDVLVAQLNEAIDNLKRCDPIIKEIQSKIKNSKKKSFPDICVKLNILEDLFLEYQNLNAKIVGVVQKLEQIQIENHPEIFFSLKSLKNINILKLISKGKFKKMFLVNLKSENDRLFAMKVREKFCDQHLDAKTDITGKDFVVESHFNEKDIGLFGKECRFIVKTVATFDNTAYLFYMNEFLNGGSLAFHLERLHRFEEHQVKFFSAQIVCAFLFLHQKGYVAFATKLEHVLLDSNGNCKLSHFGESFNYTKRIDLKENTIRGFYCKEDEYSTPETYMFVEFSTDFWRLGIMVYKMLTGSFPFSIEKNNKDLNHTKLDSFEISSEAKNFISELLIIDKFERLGSKQNDKKVKENSFFNGIDWLRLEQGQLDPPFKPTVESTIDTSNFNPIQPMASINFDEITVNHINIGEYIDQMFEPITEKAMMSIKLIKQIGRGGFGKVFYVKLKSSGETFAMKAVDKNSLIKIFNPTNDNLNDYKYLLKLFPIEKEVGLLAKNCRFLVSLKYTCHSEKNIFYFMEYLNGGSLSFHLAKSKVFNKKTVAFYSAQILCAIMFLQHNEIVHGDIKLSNILLDSEGNAKLGDFGTCVHLKENESIESKIFSYLYQTPEAASVNNIHSSFDYWSLGICLFKMILGRQPFQNRLQIASYDNSLDITRKEDKKLGPAKELVLKLLRTDPYERMANSKNLKENSFFNKIDWKKLENGELKPPITPQLDNQFSNFDLKDTEENRPDRKLIGAKSSKLTLAEKRMYEAFETSLEDISTQN